MSSDIRLGFGLVGWHTIVLTGEGVLSVSIFDDDDSTNPEELEYLQGQPLGIDTK